MNVNNIFDQNTLHLNGTLKNDVHQFYCLSIEIQWVIYNVIYYFGFQRSLNKPFNKHSISNIDAINNVIYQVFLLFQNLNQLLKLL